MNLYFVRDSRGRFRLFSSVPVKEIEVRTSRLKKIWEEAKKKLMLLPPRILAQEQAFGRMLGFLEDRIEIWHSGSYRTKQICRKLDYFLRRQRTMHLAALVIELILLPVSGLMALIPGPNVFFGVLALIMITHWRGFRGIGRMRRKKWNFVESPLLLEWDEAVEGDKPLIPVLTKMESEFGLENVKKILVR